MALDDDMAKLSLHPVFAALETEALRLLAFSAETRQFRAGDIVFRKDEPSNCGFLILAGSIALDAAGDAADARILRPPALIGEAAMLAQTLRPATAIARETTNVLRISQQLFRRVLSEYPHSAARLRETFAARLSGFTAELDAFFARVSESAAARAGEAT